MSNHDTMVIQYHNVTLTDEYCIIHATPNLRVILSGAAQISKIKR